MIYNTNDMYYRLTMDGNRKIDDYIKKKLEENDCISEEEQLKLIQAKLLSPLLGDLYSFGSKYTNPY